MKDAIEKETFASRWSRRKQQVQQEHKQEETVAPILADDIPQDVAPPLQDPEVQRLEALNALTDEDMPDVETLGENSDYAGFMSINVSEKLRKIALKKLFHGKSYNVCDGLDEYDGNYTNFEKLDPSVITCDMKHLLKVEAEKLLTKEMDKKEGLEHELLELKELELKQSELESIVSHRDDDSIIENNNIFEDKPEIKSENKDEMIKPKDENV